jgi:hypothetical protein
MDKEYIGDSVYVKTNRFGQLELTTENGLPGDPSNTIFLEKEVWESLYSYVERYRHELGW